MRGVGTRLGLGLQHDLTVTLPWCSPLHGPPLHHPLGHHHTVIAISPQPSRSTDLGPDTGAGIPAARSGQGLMAHTCLGCADPAPCHQECRTQNSHRTQVQLESSIMSHAHRRQSPGSDLMIIYFHLLCAMSWG